MLCVRELRVMRYGIESRFMEVVFQCKCGRLLIAGVVFQAGVKCCDNYQYFCREKIP